MIKKRFISMLALLCLTVSGAWAQTETLLTTILSTGDNASFKSGSKTFDNKATVTFSGEVGNDDNEHGWYSYEERTLTVTAAEGYTITRVKFYNNEGSAFDEQAPFKAILTTWDSDLEYEPITRVNGTSIGRWGVTKIEVYGYGPYKGSLKEGTEDATSWQGKAGEGEYQALPLEDLAAGTTVSLKYSGWKLVKSVKAKKKATAEDKGKLICTDGHIHAYGEDAECTKARVAKIIYIGPTGHATYRNGLALALTDEGGWHTWQEAINACSAKNRYTTPVTNATWLLASKEQWEKMIDAAGSSDALRDGFSSVGGSNLKSDPGLYWSSTEHESDEYCEKWCYDFDDGHWGYNMWMNDCWARACLAFGALKTVTQNHSANNTWTIAEMPDDDVELEVEYFNITVPTANTADIYAGWTTPLINAGSTTGGATMKYLVTATNEQPTSTDGFSAAVPTAQATAITGPGTYYVWYYLDFESGDDSDISALAVEVTVSVHVTMKEGTFDADNWQGKAGTGEYQALPLTDLEPGTAVTVKYNGTKLVKSVKAKKAPALNLTSPAVGQVIGDDGKNYDYASLPGGVTAVAKICYVSGSNGLALALTDEGQMNWSTAISICAAHIPAFTGGTWKLATQDEWNNMITAAGGYTALRDGFSSVGGTNLQSDYYWSSTEGDSNLAWSCNFNNGDWGGDLRDNAHCVRACLAFGAQGPDPIELTSTDGETWTLASMPDYDVELEVTYYPTHAITVKEGTLDATSWQGKAGEGNYQALPLERVYAGTALSVKYNGTKKVKSVKAKGKTAAEATAEDKGKLIDADGYIYDTKDEAEDAGTTAVAKIIYIGPTGHATYNHGLALALTDEASTMVWQDAINACSAKNTSTPVTGATWLLASQDQWNYMMGPDGAGSSDALRDGFSSVGGSNLLSDYYNPYWSSTENGSYDAWRYSFYYGTWIPVRKGYDHRVRACLAFGAQGSGPDPIELTSTDGKTWTLASMPYYDVELEVEYYTYAITVKEGTLDATSWQGKAGEGNYQALPLEGVDPDKAVSVKYSGTKKVKSVKAKKKAPALNLTSPAVGQVIGDDGKNYDYASLPGGVTAVAKIFYVSGSNGLALALTDEGEMNWITAIPTCAAHTPAFTGGTWKLATKDQWEKMIDAAGGYEALRDGFESVGGSNLQSYRYWSSTEYREGFLDYAWNYNFYDIGLGWDHWGDKERLAYYVRACLAFGAQETVTLNHSANNTWAIAEMPYYDVELEVEYETALALSETTDNSAALTEWNGYEADVTLTRTLAAGSWNTFAAPFSTAIPSGWTVKELSSATFADGTLTLNFANAASIVAGKPYLVKVAANTDLSTAPFTGAIVSKDAQPFTSTYVDFIPTLGATTIPAGDTKSVLFLAAGNKLLNPSALPANMKGFRAYFQLKGETAEAKSFNIDFGNGETTGIISIEHGTLNIDHSVYDLQGRRVSGTAQKGVYIQNGKKVIIRSATQGDACQSKK